MIKSKLGILVLLFAIVGCASSDKSKSSAKETNGLAAAVLTQTDAALRAKELNDIHYKLWFGLDAERTEFDGLVEIHFAYTPSGQAEIPVDLEAGAIRTVRINGQELPASEVAARFDGHRFKLKTAELAATNEVDFAYSHPYSTDGDGFYRFRDPVDGKIYLYTHFEPFFAHRLFPCFDQPDLKATYELAVQAPADWQVISNTRETSVQKGKGPSVWAFPRSPVFSTYLFALHAGPYASWASKAQVPGAGTIPTRLFARASLAQYVDHKEWLEVTTQGLRFYSKTYGFPYPFKKYDQIIVPDFNPGAMENIGAVTFTEHFVHRSKITWDDRRNLAEVVLHEMAHMWFGDLVTMKWWDGLWLNESFATFMSSWATDEATRFKPAWQAFYGYSKRSAYREDQLVTTHPVQTEVSDTGKAFASFDRITYGKGASVLRQLKFLLGTKNFTQGIRAYIKSHAYANATIGDFIGALATASGRDLTQWRKDWLETASLNRIQAEWACDKGEITSFALKQEGSDQNPLLREHKTQIALYYPQADGTLSAKEVFPVAYSQALTRVDAAIGKTCPVAVYPNHEDYDYVKVSLDPTSLTALEHGLAKIDSSFARHMMWGSLYEMMVDGRLSAQEFASLVYTQAAGEKESQTLDAALSALVQSDELQNSAMKLLAQSLRSDYFPRTEAFTHQGLAKAAPGSDLQLIWYRSFLRSVQPGSQGASDLLAWIKSGKGAPSGLKLDQDRRWEMIRALARVGAPDAQALIQAEVAADPSDDGRKQAIGARAALPDEGERNRWLSRIFREQPATPDTHYRFAELKEAMHGIYPLNQEALTEKYAGRFFTDIPHLVKNSDAQDEEYIAIVSMYMFPPACDQEIVRKSTSLLGESDLPAAVVKSVKQRRQDVERCIRARELSASRPAT